VRGQPAEAQRDPGDSERGMLSLPRFLLLGARPNRSSKCKVPSARRN
jgi:hypothetical protein